MKAGPYIRANYERAKALASLHRAAADRYEQKMLTAIRAAVEAEAEATRWARGTDIEAAA